MSSMYGAGGFGRTGGSAGNRQTGMNQLQGQGNVIPKGYQQGQLQQFTPEQMDLFKQLFGQVGEGSQLSKLAGGDQGAFEQLEAPALKQFGQLQSGLASRFSGQGSFGGRRSSGHQLAQSSAASDFAERLQSQRMGLQRQAQQDLFGMSQQLLGQRPTEQFLTPEEKPLWQQLLLGLSPALAQGASSAGNLGLLKHFGAFG